jgi:hypothetical protein
LKRLNNVRENILIYPDSGGERVSHDCKTHETSHHPPLGLAVLAGASLVTPALASLSIDYVNVGDAGNTADPATGSLYGSVGYAYNIGKYEVTNAQYVNFLNTTAQTDNYSLYNANMSSYGITRANSSSGLLLRRRGKVSL